MLMAYALSALRQVNKPPLNRTGHDSSRVKSYVMLSDAELRRLEEAVAESGALIKKGFLMFEAIQTGLSKPALSKVHENRNRKVNFWLPRRLSEKLRVLSEANHVPEQRLIRHFLSRYLADPPWNRSTLTR